MDIGKLESLINEHNKLKGKFYLTNLWEHYIQVNVQCLDNLHKTNEAMQQHFSTINKWQARVKELKETQATEIAKCNEINSNLQEQLRLKVVENENLQIALTERDEFNQKLKVEIARKEEGMEDSLVCYPLCC